MPNGHGIEPECKATMKKAEKRGMEYLGPLPAPEVPDWIERPKDFTTNHSLGQYVKINGENNVYWVISNGLKQPVVYRALKSEYYPTTREEGTCPNCQKYVKRLEGDDYLTCHRCGWQYKRFSDKLKEKLNPF